MLERVARLAINHSKLVLALTAMLVVFSAVMGGGVAHRLSPGGFEDPSSEAARTARTLKENFGVSNPDIVLLVKVDESGKTVDSRDIAAIGTALADDLESEPGVDQVVSYWTLHNAPPLKSKDGTRAMILANIVGVDSQSDASAAITTKIEHLTERFTQRRDGVSVAVGGATATFTEAVTAAEEDLIRAEIILIPITLVLLLLVFGGLVAASLPLAIGAFAVLGSWAVLRALTEVTDVSIFALNLTTAVGLGLAIDYSLLVVSRFREELSDGHSVEESIHRTVRTAGRAVVFSGVTVAISLATLMVFPIGILQSFAYAGIAVSLLAVGGALFVLPALLALIGTRVNRLMLWQRAVKTSDDGAWHRIAHVVMRRPWLCGGSVTLILLVVGIPFLDIQLGALDDRQLPESFVTRKVGDELRQHFSAEELGAVAVVAGGADAVDAGDASIATFARQLSRVDGIGRVDAATGTYIEGQQLTPPIPDVHDRFRPLDAKSGTWWSAVPTVEPLSPEGAALTERIRALPGPFEVDVGGISAELVDGKEALFDRIPLAMVLITVSTFVLLFMMFGSVVIPAKALVLNVLSLSATFGALVWVIQEGHFSDFLGFTPTGSVWLLGPILMFCVAFGLSMDYEVFLLSRIKEEYDRTGDNRHSVALGLQRTGRIVTAAAGLLGVVFGVFATSGVVMMKMIGLGLAMAILVDATLVRAVLVPAFMRLAGDANWWAPAPLRRFHNRFGISESVRPEQ